MSNETLWQKFHVGQRVWCISDDNWKRDYPEEVFPIKDHIYTIRDIRPGPTKEHSPLYFRFVEIVNPPLYYHTVRRKIECSFGCDRFRPLREQNIEIFRQMCREASDPTRIAHVREWAA